MYSLSTLSILLLLSSYHDERSVFGISLSTSQYSILIKNRFGTDTHAHTHTYTHTEVSSKILGVATSLQLTTTNLYALPSSISGLTNTQRRIVAPYSSPWTISNYVATHRSNSVCSLNVHRAARRRRTSFTGERKKEKREKNLKLERKEGGEERDSYCHRFLL